MPKQLGEFLKEKQEPFALEVYLLERGLNVEHNFLPNCSKNSTNFFRRSSSCSLHNKKRKFIPNCSKIVKIIFSGLVHVKNNEKITRRSGNGDRKDVNCVAEMETRREEVVDGDKFSSASSTTVFYSCSDSDIEDVHYASVLQGDISSTEDSRQSSKDGNLLSIEELVAGKVLVRRRVEDNNQLSPVSVLEEIECDDGSPILKTRKYAKRTQEGSSISISLCNIEKPFDLKLARNQTQELIDAKFFAHYTKNKKAVLQTKQLLFDCVREVVENQSRNENKSQQLQKIFGAEELWKLVYENIWLWSKEPIDEANIDQLVHFDLLTSMEELRCLAQQRKDITMEIGDAIFEDISNEIFVDMMNLVS